MNPGPGDGHDPTSPEVLARVGERIRGLRLERGLRLADVAALSGLSEPHLSRLEHGQRWPSLQVLLTLASIFGVEPSALLGGPGAAAFAASHESAATWDGREASGAGVMAGPSLEVPYDRASRLALDEDRTPAPKGSPEELIGAAFAGSFSMALARQLESAGYESRRIETAAEVQLAASATGHAIAEIRLRCHADGIGIDEPTLQQIAQLTVRMCVVGRALLGVSVTLETHLAASGEAAIAKAPAEKSRSRRSRVRAG
jgi:osmotically inducible protein OsmC